MMRPGPREAIGRRNVVHSGVRHVVKTVIPPRSSPQTNKTDSRKAVVETASVRAP